MVRIVDAECIGCTDPILLADQKAVSAAAKTAATASSKTTAATTATAATTTTATTTARYSQQIFRRKILLVNIVEETNKRYPAVLLKKAYVSAGTVAVICTIPHVYPSELSVAHARFSDNIDGFYTVAVIESGESRLVAEFIKDLYFINDICGQVPECSRGIITKEITAIHGNFLHLVSHGSYVACFINDQSG